MFIIGVSSAPAIDTWSFTYRIGEIRFAEPRRVLCCLLWLSLKLLDWDISLRTMLYYSTGIDTCSFTYYIRKSRFAEPGCVFVLQYGIRWVEENYWIGKFNFGR